MKSKYEAKYAKLYDKYQVLARRTGTVERRSAEVRRGNEELKRENEELKREKGEWDRRIRDLEGQLENVNAKLKEYERRLARHENANVPSSKRDVGEKEAQLSKKDGEKRSKGAGKKGSSKGAGETVRKKRGGQAGHPGKTYVARPTHHKRHAAARCPDCKSRELEPSSEESKIEVDLQPTPQAIITRHVYVTCSCRKCGRTDISPSDDPAREAPACLGGAAREPEEQAMPKCVASGATPLTENPDAKNEPGKVGYGKGVKVETVRAFRERGTYRRIARDLNRFGIRPSHATIHSFLMATGMNMTKPTLAIMMALRMADILHIDETTFSLNGKKVWVWIFYDPATGNTLYAIRDSREHDVVKEVLGKNWNNIIVCDGWRAYRSYRTQRCWAHIITESRNIARRNPDCGEAAQVYEALQNIYKMGTQASGTKEQRQALRDLLRKRVRRLIDKYQDNPVLGGFMGKIGRAYASLFRFVTDPRVPPTNNAAERGLREIVVHRKIRGAIRSEDTMTWLGNLFTCMTTWEQRGLNHSAMVAAYV